MYEKFLLEYFRQEHSELTVSAPQIEWQVDDGNRKELPTMQSDIVLENKKRDTVLIIDAKYYQHNMQTHFDRQTVCSANIYQIFTYVKNKEYELAKSGTKHKVSGMLLYAKTKDEMQPDGKYQMSGNKIIVRTLDLYQSFAEIRKELDGIVAEDF